MISNEIRETLQKVCLSLNKYRVEYIIVGGVAVGYHGFRRISGITIQQNELKTDLDFWYRPTTENFHKLVDALEELDVKTESLKEIIFDPEKTFLKIPSKHFHMDFLPTMKGLDSFTNSKANASIENLDGNQLFILSYDDLIKNKIAVGRETHHVDIEELKKRNLKPGENS